MRFISLERMLLVCFAGLCLKLYAQDPVGILEGQIKDSSGGSIAAAEVAATNQQTGFTARQRSGQDGAFHFASLPVGEYNLRVNAKGFADLTATAIRIDIGRTVRLPVQLEIAAGHNEVTVVDAGATVDLGSTLGNVISSREAADCRSMAATSHSWVCCSRESLP